MNLLANDILILTPDDLRHQNLSKSIEEIWYRDFNESKLPLKAFIDARVIIYQTPDQETKIIKSGTSINGVLLNENWLIKEGWVANLETNRYEKEDEDFYLRLGSQYPLTHPISNQQIMVIQAIDVYDKVDDTVMCTVSTLEELKNVFEEDEFLYSAEDEERIPQIPEFTLD